MSAANPALPILPAAAAGDPPRLLVGAAVGLLAADGFAVVFELPPDLVELCALVGNDLPVLNGDERWGSALRS